MASISISDLYRGEGPGEKYGGILNAVFHEIFTKGTMPAGCKHTVIAETELQLIEVQIGDEISVTDKIKYELKD